MALTKERTQIKVGKTYYHKIGNYPVIIKATNTMKEIEKLKAEIQNRYHS